MTRSPRPTDAARRWAARTVAAGVGLLGAGALAVVGPLAAPAAGDTLGTVVHELEPESDALPLEPTGREDAEDDADPIDELLDEVVAATPTVGTTTTTTTPPDDEPEAADEAPVPVQPAPPVPLPAPVEELVSEVTTVVAPGTVEVPVVEVLAGVPAALAPAAPLAPASTAEPMVPLRVVGREELLAILLGDDERTGADRATALAMRPGSDSRAATTGRGRDGMSDVLAVLAIGLGTAGIGLPARRAASVVARRRRAPWRPGRAEEAAPEVAPASALEHSYFG